MDTRSVFMLGIGVLALIVVVAVTAIFWPDEMEDSEKRLVALDDLEERQVVEFPEHDLFAVWNDGDPLVLSADAQHVPGEHVQFCHSSQLFESPAHGEKFDIRGTYYAGPGARGLDRYPVRVVDDAIYVDLDNPLPGPERREVKPLEPEGPFCVFIYGLSMAAVAHKKR